MQKFGEESPYNSMAVSHNYRYTGAPYIQHILPSIGLSPASGSVPASLGMEARVMAITSRNYGRKLGVLVGRLVVGGPLLFYIILLGPGCPAPEKIDYSAHIILGRRPARPIIYYSDRPADLLFGSAADVRRPFGGCEAALLYIIRIGTSIGGSLGGSADIIDRRISFFEKEKRAIDGHSPSFNRRLRGFL
ncbi:hypothetical protein SUGI_1488170 [Cryptomeria japonica]|uniref:Uncharacterized protein n=1 Tax=Cryptomeria japonica TaxID=3369 RepID=A0AAD3RRJ5_CRYJA|nr:hypothetical protein SUGI_1373240 [Cryptomeria japonica]GLJ59004.1 hypothetical protein SUGI_1488170 [Cryptomeria japonica]